MGRLALALLIGMATVGAADDARGSQSCSGAQQAINHYRQVYTTNREKMGLPGAVPRVWYGCGAARRRAVEWRTKARAARAEWRYQYDWQEWLPRGWYRIGSCETGHGNDPNWRHNSGTHQGAFGFAVSSWDSFVDRADPQAGPYPSEAYLATPRQQYEVALAIYRRYGLTGWGCRAYF